jgi:hypothetical protein
MRWGLIARSERDRGLGIQTKAMYDNLHPDKTLVVVNRKSGFESHPEDYPDATVIDFRIEHGYWKFEGGTDKIRDWWADLDVVVTVETLYDWTLADLARADGVRTVVHGNPEFWMETNPQPDVWWWPTTWRTEHLPYGKIVPVPVPDGPSWSDAHQAFDGPLKVTHVAGSGAMEDRNGTLEVLNAKRRLPGVEISIYDQKSAPVADRFDMYRGHHALVLPRRYGGLCLPALEAMASGLVVLMPDCSPNRDWPIVPLYCEPGKVVHMQTGPVQLHGVYARTIMDELKALNSNRHRLHELHRKTSEWAQRHTWAMLKEKYHREINIASRI